MEEYIRNPETQKWITTRGKVYADLLKSPYAKKARQATRHMRPSPGSQTRHIKAPNQQTSYPKAKPSLKKELKSVPKTRRRLGLYGKDMIANAKSNNNKTKGWSLVAPQAGVERHDLMQVCGPTCFLLPGNEGFPICQSLRVSKSCKVDCRGIHAASIRARQWKYEDVYSKSQKLKKQYQC